MNAPAELETIANRLQIFYCLRLISGIPNHPDSSPRAKNNPMHQEKEPFPIIS